MTAPRRQAANVFVLLLGVYLLSSSFRIDNIDTAIRYEVARSLVERGAVDVPPIELATPYGVVGSFAGLDGRHYAVYGLGQSLLMTPFALLGERLAGAVALLNPLATALTFALLSLLGQRLGFSARASLRAALLCGLCSLAWPQAKLTFEVPLEMLCLTGCIYALVVDRRALAGLALGAALLIRPTAAAMIPAVAMLLLYGTRDRRARALRFALGALPPIAIALVYNWVRWGELFGSGYAQTQQTYFTWSPEGIYGLVLSPGKGFFWYSPALILALWGGRALFARHRELARSLVLAICGYVVGFGFTTVWHGDVTWGPRHLLPLVPVLGLFALPVLEPGVVKRALAIPLITISCLVQLVGVMVSYYTFTVRLGDTPYARDWPGYNFHVASCPLRLQTAAAVDIVSRLPDALAAARRQGDLHGDNSPYASHIKGNVPATFHLPTTVATLPDLWLVYFPLIGVSPWLVVALAASCALMIAGGLWGLRRGRAPP